MSRSKRIAKNFSHARRGQAIILAVFAIGGSILGATTIAGLLMIYQLRQSTDIENSTKAIFAAEAGVEWATYNVTAPLVGRSLPTPLENGARIASVECYDGTGALLPACDDLTNTSIIKSLGQSGESSRALIVSYR